jgi:Big-like domain-containing protein
MSRKWFSVAALIITAIVLLSVSSCGSPQELVSINVAPGTETFGASNIPVNLDAGLIVQLRALGTYVHPPVTKDITNQVVWASNDAQMVTVNSTGLATATGNTCGGTLISATVNTNADTSGLSASGAIVTGYMTANVVCFTGTTGGGGGGEPSITVSFAGAGSGIVTSTPAGLSCANTDVSCIASFPAGTPVTLTATPVGTSVFGGWTGGCTGGTCVIVLQDNTSVTATFN